jgi:hypothetical protein
MESFLGALPRWLPLPEPRETGSFGIQMIETFVSFVIFVVNDIRLSNSGYPQKSLKTLNVKTFLSELGNGRIGAKIFSRFLLGL